MNDENQEIKKILNYIGVDDDNPNMGTKAKRNLLTKILEFCINSGSGNYNSWVGLISIRFNMSVRTVKENYIEPLITANILNRDNNVIRYLGIPVKENSEELEKAISEAKKRREGKIEK